MSATSNNGNGSKPKSKRGGARAGAGRKPSFAVLMKNDFIASKAGEAEYAFALTSAVMRNDHLPTLIRLAAAREVLDRVWGKPKQSLKIEDWRSEIIDLLKRGLLQAEAVRRELGNEIAEELLIAAGMTVEVEAKVNEVVSDERVNVDA